MMPGASTLAFNAGSSGRLTQNGMSMARTAMPTRPPGRVTRTISESISSASPSSNTVEESANIDGTVGQRQGLGQALAEIDPVEEPLAAGQCPRLAQQIWVDVAADQAVGTARAPRQLAHDNARAATDLQHSLARHDPQRIEQSAYDGHISGAAALLEAGDAADGDAAEQRAA